MIHNSLNITVCKDAADAIRQGFLYRDPVYRSMRIERVVIVQGGTESGKSTVDLILEDPLTGQKYVAMLTGALVKSIPC